MRSDSDGSSDWFDDVDLATLSSMLTTVFYQCVESLADPMWELRRMAGQVGATDAISPSPHRTSDRQSVWCGSWVTSSSLTHSAGKHGPCTHAKQCTLILAKGRGVVMLSE